MDDEARSSVRLLLQLCAQLVGAEQGSLLLVDSAQDPPEALVFALTVGDADSERMLTGQRVPLGEGIVGLAAVTHEVQIGAPIYRGIAQARRRDARPGQPTSVLAAPVLARDELVGVITAVRFDDGGRFTPEQALLYGRAASVAGLLLDPQRRLSAGGADRDGDPAHARLRAAWAHLLDLHAGRLDELADLLEVLGRLAQARR